ncbi:thioester domain-containing protein [Glycomyces sp. NPDC046736]|uniref:thioester domain-containing protein n=1 Tax=Glycomyces sp. NPDC046736 TaxID=3155615 RepID=UPI0033ECB920
MTKALKGTLAAAAGIALALGGVATAAQAQEDGPGILAAGDVSTSTGIRLHGDVNGSPKSPQASLIDLEVAEGEHRTVYCIQINVPLLPGNTHEERAWDDVPVEQLPLVLGVLVNGYNGSNADELLAAAEVVDGDFGSFSADQIAYAGTQSAVWSLTDGWTLKADATEGSDALDAAVTAVQNYLLDNSEPIDEPDFEPAFEVDDSAAVADGTKVGPFTVATNLDAITFAQPDGATIVDENGEAVTSFVDGQTFYVEFADELGTSVSLVADTITWTTPVGRTFVPVDGSGEGVEGQRLILAGAHTTEYTPELTIEIAVEEVPTESPAAPKETLDKTGTDLTMIASVGGAVLLAGVVAMVLLRRRSARADWGSEA